MVDGLSADKGGIKTVLAENVRPDDPVPGSCETVEQLDLLPLRKVGGEEGAAETKSLAGRGRGRPAGSQNKSTKAWQEFLLSQYSSPLVALAETYSRPVTELAKELGFQSDDPLGRKVKPDELLDIFKIQMQCAKELAPYVHQKQPMAIDAGTGGLMSLIINTGVSQQQVDDAGEMQVNFIDVESEQYQRVSDDVNQNSVVSNSVDDSQAVENKEETGEKLTD